MGRKAVGVRGSILIPAEARGHSRGRRRWLLHVMGRRIGSLELMCQSLKTQESRLEGKSGDKRR